MDDVPVFRAPKKRKINAQSIVTGEPKAAQSSDTSVHLQYDLVSEDAGEVNSSNVIKASKRGKTFRPGLSFTAADRNRNELNDEIAAVSPSDPKPDMHTMLNRFVSATGQVTNVDKHMVDYVDNHIKALQEHQPVNDNSSKNPEVQQTPIKPHRDPEDTTGYAQYRLSEVQLPQSAKTSDTAGATQTVNSHDGQAANTRRSKRQQRPRKLRMGRDGKPLRPRQRYRRPSQDVARDALVEQVLHEHKVDHSYASDSTSSDSAEDASGDEAFAERFKQGFMDQIAERQAIQQQRNKAPIQSKTEIDKGPKLGGSRAARAKMQAQQLNEATQKR